MRQNKRLKRWKQSKYRYIHPKISTGRDADRNKIILLSKEKRPQAWKWTHPTPHTSHPTSYTPAVCPGNRHTVEEVVVERKLNQACYRDISTAPLLLQCGLAVLPRVFQETVSLSVADSEEPKTLQRNVGTGINIGKLGDTTPPWAQEPLPSLSLSLSPPPPRLLKLRKHGNLTAELDKVSKPRFVSHSASHPLSLQRAGKAFCTVFCFFWSPAPQRNTAAFKSPVWNLPHQERKDGALT